MKRVQAPHAGIGPMSRQIAAKCMLWLAAVLVPMQGLPAAGSTCACSLAAENAAALGDDKNAPAAETSDRCGNRKAGESPACCETRASCCPTKRCCCHSGAKGCQGSCPCGASCHCGEPRTPKPPVPPMGSQTIGKALVEAIVASSHGSVFPLETQLPLPCHPVEFCAADTALSRCILLCRFTT